MREDYLFHLVLETALWLRPHLTNMRTATDTKRLREKLWSQEKKYANNPENLLTYVYASRLGNGDEESGDGFRYRGRGIMQLTGKSNYAAFTAVHNKLNPGDKRDFVATPDLLTTTRYGIESAFFFWDSKGLNKAADTDDLKQVTLKFNGRRHHYMEAELHI